MKPLLYLAKCSVVNGVRRSFQTPVRALATILFAGLQLMWLSRAFFGFSGSSPMPDMLPSVGASATETIVTLGFCFFAFVSWSTFLMLFQSPLMFQLADVDVTTPTPLKARTFLMFNFAKGYLARLLWPLLMLLFAARPFARITRSGGLHQLGLAELSNAFKTATLAYLVMQLAWATWRYATGLIWSESEQRSVKLRSIASWACGIGGFVFLGTIIYRAAFAFRDVDAGPRLLALAKAPDIQILLFPAVAAINLGAEPLTGDTGAAVWGFLFLAVMAAGGFAVMFARAPKIYEIAARVAVTRAEIKQMRTGQQQQGTNLMRARAGKMRVRQLAFLTNVRMVGDMAFWWKEVVILSRSAGSLLLLALAIPFGFGYLANFLHTVKPDNEYIPVLLTTSFMVFGPAIVAAQAQNGFRDFLRKGDLLRPLPLKYKRLLFVEAFSKCVPSAVVILVSLTAIAVFLPEAWGMVLPTWLTTVAMCSFASVSSLFLSILLPDQTDPAQNTFRRLVQGLGVTLFVYAAAIGYGFLESKSPLLAAAVVLPVAGGLTVLCLWGASRSYRNFNPAD